MALSLIAGYDFTSEADTSFGAAGTTTGSAGALIDVSGNSCRIQSGRLVITQGAAGVTRNFRRPDGELYAHAMVEIEFDHSESSVVAAAGSTNFYIIHGLEDSPNENENYNQQWGLADPAYTGSRFNTVRRSPNFTMVGANYAGAYPDGSSVLFRSERVSAGPTTWAWSVESPVGSVWKTSGGTVGSDNQAGWQHKGRMGLSIQGIGTGTDTFKIKKLRFYAEDTPDPLQAGTLDHASMSGTSSTFTANAPADGVAPYSVTLRSGTVPNVISTDVQTISGLDLEDFPVTFNPVTLTEGEVRWFNVRYQDSAGGDQTPVNPHAATTTSGLEVSDFAAEAAGYAAPLPFSTDVIGFMGSSSMAGGAGVGEPDGPGDASAPVKMGMLLEEGGWLTTATIVNRGEPTTTTSQWRPGASNYGSYGMNLLERLRQGIAATSQQPKFIFAYLGTNDARLASGVGPTNWENYYKEIFEHILTNAAWAGQRPTVGIVIMQTHYIDTTHGTWDGFFGPNELNDILTMNGRGDDIAAYVNGLSSVISAGDARVYTGREDEFRSYVYKAHERFRPNDYLHPSSPTGYEVMARLMQLAYLGLLSQEGPSPDPDPTPVGFTVSASFGNMNARAGAYEIGEGGSVAYSTGLGAAFYVDVVPQSGSLPSVTHANGQLTVTGTEGATGRFMAIGV